MMALRNDLKLNRNTDSRNELDESGGPFTRDEMGFGFQTGIEPGGAPCSFQRAEHVICNQEIRCGARDAIKLVCLPAHLAVEKETWREIPLEQVGGREIAGIVPPTSILRILADQLVVLLVRPSGQPMSET